MLTHFRLKITPTKFFWKWIGFASLSFFQFVKIPVLKLLPESWKVFSVYLNDLFNKAPNNLQ